MQPSTATTQATPPNYLSTEVQSLIILEYLRDLKQNPIKPPPRLRWQRWQSSEQKHYEGYWHRDRLVGLYPLPKPDYTNERRVFQLLLVNKTWCQIALEELIEKHDKGWFGDNCWYLLRDRQNEIGEVIRKWRNK